MGEPFSTIALISSMTLGGIGTLKRAQADKLAGLARESAGRHAARLRERQAANMEQLAGQKRAAGQRAAGSLREKKELAISAAQARLRGLDGLDILGEIENRGELDALGALADFESAAQGLEYGAAVERATGAGEAYAGQVARGIYDQRRLEGLFSGLGDLGLRASKFSTYLEDMKPSATILDGAGSASGRRPSRYPYNWEESSAPRGVRYG